ncbi:MAG: glycosyltransferase family 1 protein [Deltaproteobacteria bacterium]|nr:glycosyltransferase family 1 protein [Deltaproteobacteria bacterium]PWB66783.1 MAG: alpha-glucan phosphorylase [Deltaproteobacteria bacterium]
MRIRHIHVRPNIPQALLPLVDLARNLWFSWSWGAVQLFIRLNPVLWEKSYQNPVLMLGSLTQAELEAAARDESFVANLKRVHENFTHYMKAPGWFQETHGGEKDFLAAYFSCEFGIDEGLPIYSGGLGVLSGDHLKSASDLGLPLVGVGLLYQKGYFRQQLNLDGWQQEQYPDNDWWNMPVSLENGPDGKSLTIEVPMGGERVKARIWRVQVGRTPLYLLDSNLRDNSPRMREITSTLYGGDREMRIRQEILLGMGGVRALRALGLAPTVYHMNEGHSAFLAIERIRTLMAEQGVTFAEAREQVFASTVFTTHTPVPAGNEVFATELLLKYLQPVAEELKLPWQEFLGMGQLASSRSPDFGMTVFALRMAAFTNGVSRLHAETSRTMWRDLWPNLPETEIPIRSITNGIHTPSWLSHEVGELFLRYMGPRFTEKPADFSIWDRVDAIPAGELWRIHESRRERLVFFARKRMKEQLQRQGAGPASLKAAEEVLSPEALTIGFSRRFATYKRAGLLFRQPERLIRLLADPQRPVQILFAGKAHPQDLPAKELIKSVTHFASDPRLRGRLVFLENYDINVARYMVQGVDVWLNTPRRPLEASGTSGMKAAANGALNVSVLDGWWCEGHALDTGWAIGNGEVYEDAEEQDRIECEALFNLLEQEIIPLFYERDKTGLPRDWIAMMKTSMRKLGAYFNTHRMVQEYTESCYLPAHRAGRQLHADGFAGARALADWRARVTAGWSQLSLRIEDTRKEKEIPVGSAVGVAVRASLGALSPGDVSVQIYHGLLDAAGVIRDGSVVQARHEGRDGDADLFRAEIPCWMTGRYGYMARIVPRHPDLVNPFTPLLITWE